MKKIVTAIFLYFTVVSASAQVIMIKTDTMDHTSMRAVNGKVMYAHRSVLDFVFELWITDGTVAGTHQVKDINPNSNDELFSLFTTSNGVEDYQNCVFNNELYFLADDGVHGMEFWKSDGTDAGTNLFYETEPGFMGWDFVDSKVPSFCESNGTLFFKSGNAANGYELWKTDGTTAGTVEVKDIYTGPAGSNPHFLTSFNGKVYFVAQDNVNGWELFCSDGTANGTYLVKDIVPGINGAFNNGVNLPINPQFKVSGNYLYFVADNNGFIPIERHWWRTDGTTNGTIQLETTLYPLEPNSTYGRQPNTVDLNGEFIFLTSNPSSSANTSIWKSDGTVAGTTEILTSNGLDVYASVMKIGSYVYFQGRDNDSSGIGMTDGTAAGTYLVVPYNEAPEFSRISYPTFKDGNMFFNISKYYDALFATQDRLVQSNGTFQGTIVYAGAVPRSRCVPLANGDLIFYGTDTTDLGQQHTTLFKLHPAVLPPAAGWTPTVITEATRESSLEVFPNPASSKVNINIQNHTMNGGVISLVDLTGRLVFKRKLDESSAPVRSIDIPENISDGMYFLNLQNVYGASKSVTLMVQRNY